MKKSRLTFHFGLNEHLRGDFGRQGDRYAVFLTLHRNLTIDVVLDAGN